MFTRIFSAFAASALLAGCGSAETDSGEGTGETSGGENAGQLTAIDCAVGAGAGMGLDCTVETAQVEGDTVLVISHPDGGFRRLRLLPDGAGLETLDGADGVTQSLDGDVLDVSVGEDRYRLPAAPQAAAPTEDDGAVE